MMNWFKQKPAGKPAPEQKSGWFSTHTDMASARERFVTPQFKIEMPKFSAIDGTETVGAAMDSAGMTPKFSNMTNGYISQHVLDWYSAQGFIGWQLCALLAQNWLISKACLMPGRDAVRNGWEVTINASVDVNPKVLDLFREIDKKFKIKKQCIEYVKFARVFGIRHALFLVDGIDYELPFNPDGVKPGSYRGITQIDPYWITPEFDQKSAADPADPNFYNPTWWRVNGKRVHRSHFVIMRNDEPADILKPVYFYGGIPLTQKIAERVYASERTANEAPLLAMTKRLIALKIDVSQAMANPTKLTQKMEQWSQLMNNFGVKVIGEGEEIDQLDTSLTGLDETIMTQYQLVAAEAEVPATKLLGTSPKGFGASGEYEDSSYHEFCESIQENDLTPLLDRHHLLSMLSIIAPEFKMKPVNTEVAWRPVNAVSAKEQADINKLKADTDAVYISSGVLDGFDSRERLANDKESGYNGIAPIVPDGPGDRDAIMEPAKEPETDAPRDAQ